MQSEDMSTCMVTEMKAGDILLAKGCRFKSKMIVLGQNSHYIQSKIDVTNFKTSYSHVILCIAPGLFIEALPGEKKGVVFTTFHELFLEKKRVEHGWKAYRKTNSPDIDEQIFLQYYSYFIAQKYDFNIPKLQRVLKGDLLEEYDKSYCSELIVKILRASNYLNIHPGKEAKEIFPIHFDMYLQNANNWEDVTLCYEDALFNTKYQSLRKTQKALAEFYRDMYSQSSSHEAIAEIKIAILAKRYKNYENTPLFVKLKLSNDLSKRKYKSWLEEKAYRAFMKKES